MAIWTPSQGAATNAGADGGTLFKSSANGSRVIQSKVTPANAQARAGFAQWGRLAYWQDLWLGVGGQLQGQWNTYAATNPDYGLTGRAVIKSGADHFAAYFNRLELMSGTTPTAPFSTPAPSPSWTAPPAPFEEFLVGHPTFSMVLATTQPDPITLFLAVRQPSKGKGNMARSTQRPLGSYTFETMTQGELFDTACIDAAQRFGGVADSQAVQQWFTVWQAIGGYARPLLDPCWTPPLPVFRSSYVVTMVVIDGPTFIRSVSRIGESLTWISGDTFAQLIGELREDGLYDWSSGAVAGDPPSIPCDGYLYGTVLPEGNYQPSELYVSSYTIS